MADIAASASFPWPQRELYSITEDPNEIMNLVERDRDPAESMHNQILRELSLHGVDLTKYQK